MPSSHFSNYQTFLATEELFLTSKWFCELIKSKEVKELRSCQKRRKILTDRRLDPSWPCCMLFYTCFLRSFFVIDSPEVYPKPGDRNAEMAIENLIHIFPFHWMNQRHFQFKLLWHFQNWYFFFRSFVCL